MSHNRIGKHSRTDGLVVLNVDTSVGTRCISMRSVAPPRAVTLIISLYLCHPSGTVAMCVECSLVDDTGLEYVHCILTQISICWKIQTVRSFGLGVSICIFDRGNDKVA